MKHMRMHLSVAGLDEGTWFYSGMFAAPPTILKEEYARWRLDDPCVNFALSCRGADLGLNHLGTQVESERELDEMQGHMAALQPGLQKEEGVVCCYAKSGKYRGNDPPSVAWETFQSLDTMPVFGQADRIDSSKEACACRLPRSASS